MHLFFDTVWKLHIGEIPKKPPHYLSELGLKRYSESFNHSNPRQSYEIDLNKYNEAIAAIKQNALTVGNPEIINKSGLQIELWNSSYRPKEGQFYPWPGGYYVDMWNAAPRDEPSEPDEVAILTLP